MTLKPSALSRSDFWRHFQFIQFNGTIKVSTRSTSATRASQKLQNSYDKKQGINTLQTLLWQLIKQLQKVEIEWGRSSVSYDGLLFIDSRFSMKNSLQKIKSNRNFLRHENLCVTKLSIVPSINLCSSMSKQFSLCLKKFVRREGKILTKQSPQSFM